MERCKEDEEISVGAIVENARTELIRSASGARVRNRQQSRNDARAKDSTDVGVCYSGNSSFVSAEVKWDVVTSITRSQGSKLVR